ncbi:tRNA pseudouridine(65) synthase TruC [Moraxella bovis]|uniref:tRNA pseudouridine(65) synthase TruC n=1 Tax=Moraxella bovis TaxID=476 RepID=UPI002226CF9B|nr:tRNA pseudouridine(65) synthase TruC [Moraxella bovis]UYZ67838.1 tRNA pseudouridine(65) synthase TruC [Moraxella bovis]UYZ70213.1 tRNA pseudouridine(65) synthase TruC [Moraxella bovis]UYZ73878.1 tRNA pseudouridine(65) synthase TruC [Moraxella bovis]UZA13511.1 tRNA pseudouridine(65) synthase TruC [Moraxella bovis]UZA28133.1 tRNA pseudouridine(65) synthase TruC [Moraxella bovis]
MLQILYQDDDVVAVNKPAGMLVHRSWLDKHEIVFVMTVLRDMLGQHVFPVHRLDRPTSGMLLFAKSSDVARTLSLQFEKHTVEKSYLAVVRGYLLDSGRIDYPLKVKLDKIADKFANTAKEPQSAITDYENLATCEMPFVSVDRYATSRYSLMKLIPVTGRKHQLRRHMMHLFHPIVGDTTHGDTAQNRAVQQFTGVSRLLLHAHTLAFDDMSGKRITVVAPLDDGFGKVVRDFGWGNVF